MKDTRPIEVQVEELTEKQKNTVVKSFWIQLIAGILLAVVIVLIPLICYNFAISDAHDNYITAMEDPSLIFSKKPSEALKHYENLKKSGELYFWISAPVAIVVGLALDIIIKIKMPYYSDKKALYIMKQRRADKKAAKQ